MKRRQSTGDHFRPSQDLEDEGIGLDLSRVHFVGRVPYSQLIALFQVSSVHIYLTYPFVLSWSMLEAMSCGCLVLGSRTAPVEELIQDEKNGLLVDFFDATAIAAQICRVLEHPNQLRSLREAARQTIVDNYDLHSICLPKQLAFFNTVLSA